MTDNKKEITMPDDLTSLHKEIDLIQNCISRMAQNSFMIKGWAVTIVVITWAIIEINDINCFFTIMLLLPIIVFWGLDAFFLMTEKRYREMYKWVLNKRLNENSNECLYDLNPMRFKDISGSWWRCVFSKTLIPFYVCLGAVVLIATIAIKILC